MKNINDLIKWCLENISKLADKIITNSESIDDSKNVFVFYSTTPLGDIARISVSIAILICLFNIAVTYSAYPLLVYFNEKNYPRLTKWIKKVSTILYMIKYTYYFFFISLFGLYVELTILKYGG